jgi:hypothetical protein
MRLPKVSTSPARWPGNSSMENARGAFSPAILSRIKYVQVRFTRRPQAPWRRSREIAADDLKRRGGEEKEGGWCSKDASDDPSKAEGLTAARRRARRWGRLGQAHGGGGGCLVRVVWPTVGTGFWRLWTMRLERSIFDQWLFSGGGLRLISSRDFEHEKGKQGVKGLDRRNSSQKEEVAKIGCFDFSKTNRVRLGFEI